MTESSIRVYILYGSQNGQSQSIAEGLHEDAIFEGIDCKVFCLKDEGKLFDIRKIKLAVFICSTTGDGDPPENARSFIDKLNNLPAADDDNDGLNQLHFALLGLGNSDYSTFCGGPKKLLTALSRLHATQFYSPARFADDATDGDDVTDEWIDHLWDHVKKAKAEIETTEAASSLVEEMKTKMQMHDDDTPTMTSLSSYPDKSLHRNTDLADVKLTLPPLLFTYIHLSPTTTTTSDCHGDDDVITATVTSSKRLTSEDSDKVTMELELQVDEEVDYQPGDAFEFQCPNSQEEIEFLMSRLQPRPDLDDSAIPQTLSIVDGFEGKQPPRHLPSVLHSIKTTLTWLVDIRAVCKKSLIRALADVTSHEEEARRLRELCSRQGGGDYTKHVRLPQLNITDIVHNFPSCRPSVELVLQHLPPLRHRPYSVATSPRVDPNILKFAYTVVHTAKGGSDRRADRIGLATGWIQNLAPKTQLKIRHRRSTFTLPTDPTVPVIMIGPGTGVAPFIGFLEHGGAEEAHLYFGCRRPDEDYIYEEKLKEFAACGALTALHVAFSRPAAVDGEGHGKYVQDLLRENGHLVVDVVLSRGGVVYVCGDARGMSRDVRSCFVQMFADVRGCTEAEAKLLLKQLVDEKRYKEDVWA